MAGKAQLNDIFVRNIPIPAQGRVQYPDGKLPGFGVRVSVNGLKVFYLTYRFAGQSRRMILGRYPFKSLAAARAEAHTAIGQIASGIDPQKTVSNDALSVGRSLTFAEALDQFVQLYCSQHNRASTAAETERVLRSVFLPDWQSRELQAISRQDILGILDAIVARGTPSAAIHAYAAIRKFFTWSVERDLVEISPCLHLKPPAKKHSRERVLSEDEIVILWKASIGIGYPFGAIFQLLLLTGQRRGEVVGMRWTEIDMKQGVWTIPGARTKNGKAHSVPLTPRVRAILKSLPRFESPFVFPARGKREQCYSGYSKGKRELDSAAGLHDWTLHDLRRTAATGMAELGVPPHVVEKILNHSTGTFAGVAGVYNRFEYRSEMRSALRLWAAQIKRSIRRKSAET
ncbi:tyrosine-type recombinase/integrase [Hyphomicrobium sp.]|uniref:tyrosine-type recombinase/integrase n=1 Tax=Hyphomicrobium sp. TaxID=82 RepID=UPI002FE40ECA